MRCAFYFLMLGNLVSYKEELFTVKRGCIQKHIIEPFCEDCGSLLFWVSSDWQLLSFIAAPAVPLWMHYLNVSIGWIHSLMEGDKTDGGWSKSPGLVLSLHCPCSKWGGQAPVKYCVCMCMDFDWGFFVDFLQKYMWKTQWLIQFHWYWRWGKCKTSVVTVC